MMEELAQRHQRLAQADWLAPREDAEARARAQENQADQDLSMLLLAAVTSINPNLPDENIIEVLPPRDGQKSSLCKQDVLRAMAELGVVGNTLRLMPSALDTRLMPLMIFGQEIALEILPQSGQPETEQDSRAVSYCYNLLILEQDRQDHHKFLVMRPQDTAPIWARLHHKKRHYDIWIFGNEDIRGQASRSADTPASESPSRSQLWHQQLLTRLSRGLWPLALIGLVLSMLSLAVPLFIMTVYDSVIGPRSLENFWPLVTGISLAIVAELVLWLVRSQSLSWYGARLDYLVNTHVITQLLHLPRHYIKNASLVAQLARIRAFDAVRAFFSGKQIRTMVEFPFIALFILALSVISYKMAAIVVGMGMLYGLLTLWMLPILRRRMRLSAQTSIAVDELAMETVKRLEDLRSSGMIDAWRAQFRARSGYASMARFSMAWMMAVFNALAMFLYGLSGVAILYAGVGLVWAGDITAGALIASMMLTWRILTPIQKMALMAPKYVQLRHALHQVNRLVDLPTEIDIEHDIHKTETIPDALDTTMLTVEAKKVGVRYQRQQDPIFSNVNFALYSGQLVMLAGEAGAGRTTLLRLLEGTQQPQAGVLSFNGINTRQLSPHVMRRFSFYINNDPAYVSGTIEENIRLASWQTTEDEIWVSLKRLGFDTIIEGLDHGLQTRIGSFDTGYHTQLLQYILAFVRADISRARMVLIDDLPNQVLGGRIVPSFTGKESQSTSKNAKTVLDIIDMWRSEGRVVVIATQREDYLRASDQVMLLRRHYPLMVASPEQAQIELRRLNQDHRRAVDKVAQRLQERTATDIAPERFRHGQK